jgi:hypothetical protein
MQVSAVEAAGLLFYEKLTTPNHHDLVVLVNGKTAWITELQEDAEKRVYTRTGETKTADLRAFIEALPEENCPVGVVSAILCRDADEKGATDFLSFVTAQGRKKNFSVTSIIGPATTAQGVKALKVQLKTRFGGRI